MNRLAWKQSRSSGRDTSETLNELTDFSGLESLIDEVILLVGVSSLLVV